MTLTPAYDICPQARTGREASQSMLVRGDDRRSALETCRAAASRFLLDDAEARAIIDNQVQGIRDRWSAVCDEARLSRVDQAFLWGRQFLNDFAFDGYAGNALPAR